MTRPAEDPSTTEFIPFRPDPFQSRGDDLIVERIEFGIVVEINVLDGKALGDGHSLPRPISF